jgi:hypothetical protein
MKQEIALGGPRTGDKPSEGSFPGGRLDRLALAQIPPNVAGNKIDLAYFAGLFDGEGCISAALLKDMSCRIQIRITMTDRPTIEWVGNTFGGYISNLKKKAGCKPAYEWRALNQRAGFILKSALPFLKLKKEKAIKFIELTELIHSQTEARLHREKGRIRKNTAIELLEKSALISEVRAL